MSTTERLLRVFRVDQQLGGLQARLRAAERFHSEQTRQLEQLVSKRESITTQLRQLQASIADHEGEMARLDARTEKLREQMNSAQTNGGDDAEITEIDTIKADRGKFETAALECMSKSDELKKKLEEIDVQRAERERMQKVAADDEAKKAEEIKDRVTELERQREQFASEVPGDVMTMYLALVRLRGDEAMAPIDELDRRRHEYTCGGCQMAIPVETVSSLMSGRSAGAPITRCVSCGSILYIEKEAAERLEPGAATPKKGKRGKASVEEI